MYLTSKQYNTVVFFCCKELISLLVQSKLLGKGNQNRFFDEFD